MSTKYKFSSSSSHRSVNMPRSQNIQISIGVLVMCMALGTLWFPPIHQAYNIKIVRALQVTATIAFIFGIKKAPKQQESKFLLFWLIVTTIFLTSLIYHALDFSFLDLAYLKWTDFVNITLYSLGAALVAYMMIIICMDYLELAQDTRTSKVSEQELSPIYQHPVLMESKISN